MVCMQRIHHRHWTPEARHAFTAASRYRAALVEPLLAASGPLGSSSPALGAPTSSRCLRPLGPYVCCRQPSDRGWSPTGNSDKNQKRKQHHKRTEERSQQNKTKQNKHKHTEDEHEGRNWTRKARESSPSLLEDVNSPAPTSDTRPFDDLSTACNSIRGCLSRAERGAPIVSDEVK